LSSISRYVRKVPGLLLLGAALFSASCSTKKNTLVNRTYHNVTARYNGYFNATLKIQEGAKRLADSHVDQYDRILSVFRYGDAEKSKAIATVMDEAIKKSSVVIERHSMIIYGLERCKWIDENYLVIAKANFYKRDFFPAIESLQYVASEFKDNPSRYEALLWLMKVYMEQRNFADAENVLDYLNGEPNFPKKLKAELAATSASFYLQQKNFDKAISELNKAIKLTRKRADKTRYMFILGQLYQRQTDCRKAFALYGTVIKRNPVYEMAFNAKINRARCFDSRAAKGGSVKAELMKMLKDDKNKEYLDQIYYALGTIALQEKDVELAIRYLNLSVRESTINTGQKALSYLELANVYFGRPDYRKAQLYYDSTITFLSKDHPDYSDVLLKRNSLNKLVKYLQVVETEDSLQKVAAMSPADRDRLIEKIIARQKEEDERKKREEEELKTQNALFSQQNGQAANNYTQGGIWYFYNPSLISSGYTDFVRKWGNRPNEDNWRRTAKEAVVGEVLQEEQEQLDTVPAAPGDTSKPRVAGKYDKQKYYKNLPLGPKQMEKSNLRIIEAFYNISILYKEDIRDLGESVKSGEELLRRYPENQHKLAMYYSLYLSYGDMGNAEKSAYYRSLLLDKYPDSEYAQIILDPEYLKNSQARLNKVQEYYKETYELYLKGSYDEVRRRRDEAMSLYPGNKMLPKFDYLLTLITGKTKGVQAYTAALREIAQKYPDHEVKGKAEETLEYIAQMKNRTYENTAPDEQPREIYRLAPDTVHHFVIAFPLQVDAAQIKARLQEFSKRQYGESPFDLSIAVLDEKRHAVIVKQFADKDAGQDYQFALREDKDALAGLDKNSLEQFVISPDNLDTLLKDKDVATYMIFYRLNYPEVARF
jgi:outer membrane protein assembly factor BamD (BamD/ComL family)